MNKTVTVEELAKFLVSKRHPDYDYDNASEQAPVKFYALQTARAILNKYSVKR